MYNWRMNRCLLYTLLGLIADSIRTLKMNGALTCCGLHLWLPFIQSECVHSGRWIDAQAASHWMAVIV